MLKKMSLVLIIALAPACSDGIEKAFQKTSDLDPEDASMVSLLSQMSAARSTSADATESTTTSPAPSPSSAVLEYTAALKKLGCVVDVAGYSLDESASTQVGEVDSYPVDSTETTSVEAVSISQVIVTTAPASLPDPSITRPATGGVDVDPISAPLQWEGDDGTGGFAPSFERTMIIVGVKAKANFEQCFAKAKALYPFATTTKLAKMRIFTMEVNSAMTTACPGSECGVTAE